MAVTSPSFARAATRAAIVATVLAIVLATVLVTRVATNFDVATRLNTSARERLLTERIARLVVERGPVADVSQVANELESGSSDLTHQARTRIATYAADARTAAVGDFHAAQRVALERGPLVARIDGELGDMVQKFKRSIIVAELAISLAFALLIAAIIVIQRRIVVPAGAELESLAIRLTDLTIAIDSASDMVFVTDNTTPRDGGPHIVYANAAMSREFGVEIDQIVGRSPAFAYGPRTDPATVKALRDSILEGIVARAEFLCYRSDGSVFWAEWSGRPLPGHTGSPRWIAIGRNTDARRRAEEALVDLQTAIEAADDSIFVYSMRDGDEWPHPRYANRAALANNGFTLAELAEIPRRLNAADFAENYDIVGRMRAGEVVRRRLYLQRKDGSQYWADVDIRPIPDERGLVRRWVAIERNVSVDVEREAALARASAELVRAREARSRSLAMIAHDLRNPVTTILGFGSLMLENPDEVEVRETALASIIASGRRLESLAGELALVARLEQGDYVVSHHDFSLTALIADVLSYLPDGGRVSFTPSREIVIDGDAVALRHVVENLVSNALKYSSAPRLVDVTLEADALATHLRVVDRGIGIPPGDLPVIFEPETRAANVGMRRGTGLGLSFVRQLVAASGGTITVESREGQGSAFTVVLPLDPGEKPVTAATAGTSNGLDNTDSPALS